MAGNLQLLLVNGDLEKSQILSNYLAENTGFNIIVAHSGTAAVGMLKQLRIHCVISDIYLEGVDGWRLARMVRSGIFNCSADIPFIVVSSTWCKRIAEKTAREFDIDHLLPLNNTPVLKRYLHSRLLSIVNYAKTAFSL